MNSTKFYQIAEKEAVLYRPLLSELSPSSFGIVQPYIKIHVTGVIMQCALTHPHPHKHRGAKCSEEFENI